MAGVPTPDLRPLQQPLRREQLRAAKAWLREHRQTADLPGIGLAIAGWVLLLPGALILLVGLTSPGELEMVIVSAVMLAIGGAMLVGRALRRADALRRAARLVAFADANGFSYAQRARLRPKPASLLREGSDQVALDILRAPDTAEWGVWRHRADDRYGSQVLRGYIEVPWGDPITRDGPPRELLDVLRDARMPVDVEVAVGRLTIVARRSWRMTDTNVQQLVHRIRDLAATVHDRSAAPPAPLPLAIPPAPGTRLRTLIAIGSGLLLALFGAGMAFLQAALRNSL